MNPIFCLKNFRSFGEDGADFELAPITVLTGCNSAGKSSLVKALMLLSEEREAFTENIQFSKKLNISSKKLCLGGYRSVAHGDGKISMSYSIWSSDLQEKLIVKKVFCANRYDVLNNGTLSYLEVKKNDGTIVFQAKPDWEVNQNCDSLKVEFDRFCAVGCYMYFKEHFLRLLEKKEKEDSSNDTKQVKRSEEILNLVKERLVSTGVTETEAAMLWEQFNHKTWKIVIKADDIFWHGGKDADVRLADLVKHPKDEDDLKIMMETFLELVVNDVCSPFFIQTIEYINSSSAQIARLYSVEDNNKMCNALREFNNRKIEYNANDLAVAYYSIHKPGNFLNKWVEKFEIGKSIEVKGTEEGLGLMVYLNDENNKRLLADEGYGITQLVALLLQIDNCISIFVDPDEETYNNGYKSACGYKSKTICVEEPEVHLHPKYQSLLAEMFVEAYQKYNIHFIIETHSEYLIRKLQVMVADKENTFTSDDVSLNYVEKDENGVSHNRQIRIEEDGNLSDSFGAGFYDEADTLAIQLFRNKPILS